LTDYVLRLGEPWLGTGAQIQDLLDRGAIENIGPLPASWLGVPLKVDVETVGLIAVQSYSDRIRLTEEHKEILRYVSAQAAMAIQRKRSEEALRESEEKYRILFANELVAICIFEAVGLHYLDVNRAFERLYGYSREELLSGMTILDVSAERANRLRRCSRRGLAGPYLFRSTTTARRVVPYSRSNWSAGPISGRDGWSCLRGFKTSPSACVPRRLCVKASSAITIYSKLLKGRHRN
jgi:PAS domain S-box-containing protein